MTNLEHALDADPAATVDRQFQIEALVEDLAAADSATEQAAVAAALRAVLDQG